MRSWRGLALGCGAVWCLSGCVLLKDGSNPFDGLSAGDVVAQLVGVPPQSQSSVLVNLAGARARVAGSSIVRSANAEGKVVVRNLPEGSHRLTFFYDADHDGVADLARRVEVPILIKRGQRVAMSLGKVTLLKPGKITGRVRVHPSVAMADVSVVVDGLEIRVTPDASGAFTVQGLGEGNWTVVAAGGGRLSNAVEAVVTGGEETLLLTELALGEAGTGTFSAQVNEPDVGGTFGAVTQALTQLHVRLLADVAGRVSEVACRPTGTQEGSGCAATFDGQVAAFNDVPQGLYWVLVDAGEDYLPVQTAYVVVRAGATPPPLEILLDRRPPPPTNGCMDLDADGLCALPPEVVTCTGSTERCVEECRGRSARDLDAPCGTWDCDDDADGQADVVEMLGCCTTAHPACACAAPGGPAVACVDDPTRVDRDLDGICDVFDRAVSPLDPCAVVGLDGGVPDASTAPDASTPPDASVASDGGGDDAGDAAVWVPELRVNGSMVWGEAVGVGVVGVPADATFSWRVEGPAGTAALKDTNLHSTTLTAANRSGPFTIKVDVAWPGSSVPLSAAVTVRPPPVSSMVPQKVVAGGAHSLVLMTDGTVWSSGTGAFQPSYVHPGALSGVGSATLGAPVAVAGPWGVGLLHATQLCAGEDFSVALTTDGAVVAWGQHATGNGLTPTSEVPVLVLDTDGIPLSGVTQVTCGARHALALGGGGMAWAWGDNANGQLGSTPLAAQAVMVPAAPGTLVAAGGDSSLLVQNRGPGGVLAFWGLNDHAQGGSLDAGVVSPPSVESVILANRTVVDVSVGWKDVVATVSVDGGVGATEGTLGGWGQISSSATAPLYRTWTPITIPGFTGGPTLVQGVAQVSNAPHSPDDGTMAHALARLSSGAVYSWGATDNPNSLLLLPVLGRPSGQVGVPGLVVINANAALAATDVAAGGSHSLAITQPPAPVMVVGWGSNALGQLGRPVDTLAQGAPVPMEFMACGRGSLDPVYEQCDDGDFAAGDGCGPDCQLDAACDWASTDQPPEFAAACQSWRAHEVLPGMMDPTHFTFTAVPGRPIQLRFRTILRSAETCPPGWSVKVWRGTAQSTPPDCTTDPSVVGCLSSAVSCDAVFSSTSLVAEPLQVAVVPDLSGSAGDYRLNVTQLQ